MTKTKLLGTILSLALLGAACTPSSVAVESDGGMWFSNSRGEKWEHRANIYVDRTSRRTTGNINIKRLVFSPGDSRRIFAVSNRSGLWFSWNDGHFWDLILPTSTVTDLAIHPQNPKRLYAAVGNTVALSIDEGVSWRSVYTSDNDEVLVHSVMINPQKPQAIYAATSIGDVLISDDSGISWRVLSTLPKGTTLTRMQFHPQRTQTIYALANGKGLARSRDAGENWTFFEDEFDEYIGTNQPRAFSLIPTGVVYASSFGIVRSLNHGDDWTVLPLISGTRQANIFSLAVNRSNPLEIYYGTRSTLYHSVDGGFNWIPRSLPSTRAATALSLGPDDPTKLYMGVALQK